MQTRVILVTGEVKCFPDAEPYFMHFGEPEEGDVTVDIISLTTGEPSGFVAGVGGQQTGDSLLMDIYYAHCLALYGTAQERRDLETLATLFPHALVHNPADAFIDSQCRAVRERFNVDVTFRANYTDDSDAVMEEVFKPLVQRCQLLVFRGTPEGSITSGVAREIRYAEAAGIPVLELPSGLYQRMLCKTATREYLREVGQR